MKIKPNLTISWRRIVIQTLIPAIVLGAVVSYAADVASIKVRGKAITINDTADQVFEILKESDIVDQEVRKDPNNPNSLLVVKNYKVNGKIFTLFFARVQDPGPYRVIRITAD